ncbi:zinc carboxypeptidase A 1 [Scaptodrosophila lebanonensis]|uniref:Zinc carboxypeptidase A 1 n=1 Tax=Drosophila lebanonensis TaxID=7225 RepID=A0A6J2TVD5_DROLE|nr:zinc carboxypeptidase A 1 [Scaptodrosophila lebanonensis]
MDGLLAILVMSVVGASGTLNSQLGATGTAGAASVGGAGVGPSGTLTRIPFFGAGVRQLLRYIRPQAPYGRTSDYRSQLNENYVHYYGAQLWKLNFNATRKRTELPLGTDFSKFAEQYATSKNLASKTQSQLLLWRSITGLPSLPALWSVNTSDLYETTLESLQWLSPTDLRRFDFLSPGSTYQINRRYRSDASVRRYYGHQLWKVHETKLNQPAVKAFWRHFGSEVWNINQDGIDILINQKNKAAARQFMEKVGFSYNVMIEDIELAIDETYMEVNNSNPAMPWLERKGALLDWQRYHDYGDIQQFLQHMLETYPDLTEIIQIGLTNNKRPLEVLRISNGDPENFAVFVDAGLQARDWLSPAALTYTISKLMSLWDNKETHMQHIDWYFLSVSNPDGYQYTRITDRLWSKNRRYDSDTGCYGVNLDRNFEYSWGEAGSSTNPCKNLYSGIKTFSEPETRAMRNFLLSIRKVLGAYVSLGGYGQAITYPWGDDEFVTDNQRELHKVAYRAALNLRRLNQAEYSVGSSYRLKLARAGNSADWVQDAIAPRFVYNVFLKDQGRYGYLMPPHYIVESGEEAFDFLQTIAQQFD